MSGLLDQAAKKAADALTPERVRQGVERAEDWLEGSAPERLRGPGRALLDVLDDRAEEVASHGRTAILDGLSALQLGMGDRVARARYLRYHATAAERLEMRRQDSAASAEGRARKDRLEEAANGFLDLIKKLLGVAAEHALPLAMEALKR